MVPFSSLPSPPHPIGIVGGVGPQAGFDLASKITAVTRATKDQDHLPLFLSSLPHRIPDRTAFLLGRSEKNPGYALADIALALVEAGAEVIGVPCHTAHAPRIFECIQTRLAGRADLVHMVEEVGRDVEKRFPSVETVGILSTTGTLVVDIYPDRLRPLGYAVLQLPLDLQERYVQPAIYDADYGIKSVSSPPSPRAVSDLKAAATHLIEQGAELVVMACTEIPLALTAPEFGGVPLLDPTRVLARALVRRSAPHALIEEPATTRSPPPPR